MSLRVYGNRQLKTLPGLATRPTPGLVRQAVFNIWQGKIESCRWLDLCAGSGAMGAEALSRRAAFVLGIEQSKQACSVIQQNWQQIAKPEQQFQIIRGDVVQQLKSLASQGPFDRIYFDPPYASELYLPVISAIAKLKLLDLDGELAVEHSRNYQVAEQIASLVMCRQKVYGSTGLTFYQVGRVQPFSRSNSDLD